MLGPWINSGALLLGGALGTLLGKVIPKWVREALPLSCGIKILLPALILVMPLSALWTQFWG